MQPWLLPIFLSAIILGIYDTCRKHAVKDNSASFVLFLSSLSGFIFLSISLLIAGKFIDAASCSFREYMLIFLKTCIIGSSWGCVYTAMKKLPISIAAPIRSSAPLWTILLAIPIFHEQISLITALGMLIVFCGYYGLSNVGSLEGFSIKSKSMLFLIAGTLIGSCGALFDKFILGSLKLSPLTVQFYFSFTLTLLFGLFFFKNYSKKPTYAFYYRWTIPATGILLIISDFVYFYAVNIDGAPISIITILRRCSCVITFLLGAFLFHDKNIKKKFIALLVILLGVLIVTLSR